MKEKNRFPGKNVRTCLKVAAPEKGLRFHRESIRAPPVQGPKSPPRSGTLEVMCQADPAVRLPGFPEAVFLECGSMHPSRGCCTSRGMLGHAPALRQIPLNNSLRPAVSSFTCTLSLEVFATECCWASAVVRPQVLHWLAIGCEAAEVQERERQEDDGRAAAI